MYDLSGKTALVTGGSRGIGRTIVEFLAEAGAAVLFNHAQSQARADALVQRIGSERCRAVRADLAEQEAPDRLWNEAVAWKGRVDVLVNNAATRPAVALDAPTAEWDHAWEYTLRVNLIAAAHLCRRALQHFREHGGGVLINIASRPAFRGDRPDFLHDGASKGGLVALTRGIARFFAHENVLCYVVVPGMIATEQVEEFVAHYGASAAVDEIPMKEIGKPADVAEIVRFLASGKARYATGATIDINGASYFS